MTMKPATDQTLKLKTWVLKVSIDCQGCQKKVQKILRGIEGVYATVVDGQHNKVTVTGDVDADTLIKKLAKSGKHAELILSEKPPEKKKEKSNKQSKNEKQRNPRDNGDERKCDTGEEGPKTGGDVGNRQKKNKKKQSGGEVGDNVEASATTVVGSPVSTLPPLDAAANYSMPVSYGMSTYPYLVMDPMRYNADEYEYERSGCFIM